MPMFNSLLSTLKGLEQAVEDFTGTDNPADAIEAIGQKAADYTKAVADCVRHLQAKTGKGAKVSEAQEEKLSKCKECVDRMRQKATKGAQEQSQKKAQTTPDEQTVGSLDPSVILMFVQIAEQLLQFIHDLRHPKTQ
jgi:ATPase subunit of ABC transporter with duplicated ATPase domains